MTNIQTVDRLEVLIVVDNVTDSLSSNPNKCKRSGWGMQSGQIGSLKTSSQSDAESVPAIPCSTCGPTRDRL